MNNKQLARARFEWSEGPNPWNIPARHVLLLLYTGTHWLVTEDYTRGIEFPGGKVEPHETIEEAVKRETWEETSVIVHDVKYIGEFTIFAPTPFCKAVYTGTYVGEKKRPVSFEEETAGALWLTTEQLFAHPTLSYHMTIREMRHIMKKVSAYEKK